MARMWYNMKMTMVEVNIIGDPGARYKTFLSLVNQMPKAKVLAVGDVIDRGPAAREMIEWLMANGDSLMGNHEHQMVDSMRRAGIYDVMLWEYFNGGLDTLKSYNPSMKDWVWSSGRVQNTNKINEADKSAIYDMHKQVPPEHLAWIASRPLYFKAEGLLVTHAAYPARKSIEQACDLGPRKVFESLIWNIREPKKMDGIIQIFGHHAKKAPLYFYDPSAQNGRYAPLPMEKPFAIDIDSGLGDTMSGIHWPSMQVFTQKNLDEDYKNL
jgi:hypothetical protein